MRLTKIRVGRVLVIIIILAVILFISAGAYFYFSQVRDFKVNYYSKQSSSGGDRILNMTYLVKDGAIVSCDGTYSFPPSAEQQSAGIFTNNIEQCDVQRLKNKKYNVPIKLVTVFYNYQKMNDEFAERESMYTYQIFINN